MKNILITGASGLLGRAIYKEFKNKNWNVLGLAYSRATGDYLKVNILDSEAVQKVVMEFQPNVIIHCAAERSPEKVEKEIELSTKLNVSSSGYLAKLSAELKCAFLYISTDYVFDGKNPPFEESEEPSPVNQYGKSKLEGEREVMKHNQGSLILRIPVLYGEESYLGESAISDILKKIMESSAEKLIEINNYETRYPATTKDIATVCHQLIEYKLKDDSLNSVFHWCGKEPLTKYTMAVIIADVCSMGRDYVLPLNSPRGNEQCKRPIDVQLSCKRLEQLGIGCHTPFREGVKSFKKLISLICI